MKIYTKTGDGGQTALFGAGRVSKAHPRVAAYGDVDELNAVLGLAIAAGLDSTTSERLQQVQHDLFVVGSNLATPPVEGRRAPSIPDLPEARPAEMEAWIDEGEAKTGALKAFILPGGTPGAAHLHVARTVCRRAERAVVALSEADFVDPGVTRYLNRLSDLLFQLARVENHRSGSGDIEWVKPDA